MKEWLRIRRSQRMFAIAGSRARAFTPLLVLAFAIAGALVPQPSFGAALDAFEFGEEYEDGRVLVELADGATLEDLEVAGVRMLSVGSMTASGEEMAEGERSGEAAAGVSGDAPAAGLAIIDATSDFVLLELPAGVSIDDAIEALGKEACVAGVQPNHVYHAYEPGEAFVGEDAAARGSAPLAAGVQALGAAPVYPDDPAAARISGQQSEALSAVNAYDAWALSRGAGSVTVAVLDSGCDISHPDLKDNVIAEAAYNVFDGSSDVADGDSHGTHVAGIAAATADNGLGIAGLSYNARILPVKAIDAQGKITSFEACKGMRYIGDVIDEHPEYNIRVLNMSFGGKVARADADDQAVVRAIDGLVQKGVLPVCAAGNTDANRGEVPPYRSWPGDFSGSILGVINADGDVRATSSNYNKAGQTAKAICAPGTDIYSTVPGGGYGSKSGTSMAAPCVSGIAALVFAANPDLQPCDVASILCSTARDLGPTGFDDETGFGMVDAAAAVRAAESGDYLVGERSVLAGATLQLAPASADARNLVWTSSDPSIASVDSTGLVTGKSEGMAIVSAQGEGGALVASVTVFSPRVTGAFQLKAGQTSQWQAKSGQPAVWVWESGNEEVAAVGESGLVRGVAPGTAIVRARLSSNPAVCTSALVAVTPAKRDLSEATVELEAAYPFTGDVVMPRPVVLLDGNPLRAGEDFKLSYRDNTRPGTAIVQITGIGDCEGSIVREFLVGTPIDQAEISLSSAVVFSGSPQEPRPLVVFDGRALELGKDYEMSYRNNTNVGIASAQVIGKGGYYGSVVKQFEIMPAPNTLKAASKAKTKKRAIVVSARKLAKKSVTISAQRAFSVKGAKGKVVCKKVGGDKKIAVGKNGRIVLKRGLKPGLYTVRVNVTAAGDPNYKAKTVKGLAFVIRVKR